MASTTNKGFPIRGGKRMRHRERGAVRRQAVRTVDLVAARNHLSSRAGAPTSSVELGVVRVERARWS